jgi:uncharacterized protein YbcI
VSVGSAEAGSGVTLMALTGGNSVDSEADPRQRNFPEQERTDLHLAELSNAMVRLYKEQFGRGPTRARVDYAGPDTLIATLEETLTPAERKLVEMGEHQRLRDARLFTQYASARDFIEAVEQLTGRRVRAYVSGMDTEHDVASEVFYLHPIE